MQITIKFKNRSKGRAVTQQHNSRSIMRGSSRLADPPVPALIGSCFSVSRDDEESRIVPGVNALNNFLDLGKKLPEPPSDSSLSSVEAASGNIEKAIQLDQIPVEEVQVHPGSRIVMQTDPRSAGADRFRFLRMCLRELWNSGKLKTLQITSPLPQDGKSTIAMNLATALAEGGKRTVLLLEADLHRPTLMDQLGLEKRAGLADCLEGSVNPISALRRLEPLGWYLLPAGEPRSNPTELLQTEAFAGVLQKLSPHFDWILLDSPPVIPLTDALSLARQANATLLVAREGRTPREAIEKSIAVLGRQRVLGIVLNAVTGLDRMYSGYYGYSGYSGSNGLKAVGRAQPLKESLARVALPAKHSILDPPKQ
jgi:capsular exopolysaccharide synthesis family protein